MKNQVDVAVLGGGSAGALAAARLGRMGISTMVVDIHATYPAEFRCEKIHSDQAELFKKLGLSEVLSAATPLTENWVARHGHVIGKKHGKLGDPYEYGVSYGDLVNAIRRQIPESVPFICAKVNEITTSPERQTIALSNGDTWSARLVVVATGLNNPIREITRSEISKSHSISIGFDIASKSGFKFQALTWFAEKPGPMAYVSLFPLGSRMRANVFVYHGDIRDPWCREARTSPLSAIFAVLPRLKRLLGDAEVVSDVRIRPIDLYRVQGHDQLPGVVLVGDSFATSDPAAGTGLNKCLTDIDCLCHHIPVWLATPGMGNEKIRVYYDDPVKIACDQWSLGEAYYQRSLATDTSLMWGVRRMGWIGLDMMGISVPQLKELPHRLFRKPPIAEVNRGSFSLPKIGSWYARQQGLEPNENAGLKWIAEHHGAITDLLDLGVGAGRTVEPLCRITKNYTGVDFSPAMISICQQRFPDKTFRLADARDLWMFPAASFDVVFFSFNGIDYVDHEGRLAVLAEARRVLRPKGVFVFSSHNRSAKPISWWREGVSQQVLRLSWSLLHLPWIAVAKIRHLRLRRLEINTQEYEIKNDSANGYRLLTYYVDPEKQIEQLRGAGFSHIEIFDMAGYQLRKTQDIKNIWLNYCCEKE